MKTTLNISEEDKRKIKRLVNYFLYDSHATFSSQSRAEKELVELAKKYKTTTQIIFDSYNPKEKE